MSINIVFSEQIYFNKTENFPSSFLCLTLDPVSSISRRLSLNSKVLSRANVSDPRRLDDSPALGLVPSPEEECTEEREHSGN